MKILIATPEYRGFGGGIMTFYRQLAPELVKAGCQVRVMEGSAFQAFDQPNACVMDGVRVESLEASRVSAWSERFTHLSAAPTLRRMISASWAAWEQASFDDAPDIVEATDFGLLSLPHLLISDTPCITQLHGAYGQIKLWEPERETALDSALALALETATVSMSTARQANAQANADYWTRQANRPVQRILPAWSGPEHSIATPVEDRISVFGRIQSWKGPRIVCEALRMQEFRPLVVWHGRDVSIDGVSTDAKLRADFPDIWGQRIVPQSPVPPDQVAAIMASSKLNLVASVWDVFNFTIVEAMHSSRPLVCSRGAGASELIEDNVTGFLYDGQSPEALAEALARALATSEVKLTEIGRNAREHVARALIPAEIVPHRIAAYKAAVKVPRKERPSPPDWLRQIVEPRPDARGNLAFLEQLPLRDLATYVVTRTVQKLGLKA